MSVKINFALNTFDIICAIFLLAQIPHTMEMCISVLRVMVDGKHNKPTCSCTFCVRNSGFK